MLKIKIKWIKDKDGSLWTARLKPKTIYCIFNTLNKATKYCIGIYRNIRVRRNGTLRGSKPLFYDGFTLSKAKQIVRDVIKLDEKKIICH